MPEVGVLDGTRVSGGPSLAVALTDVATTASGNYPSGTAVRGFEFDLPLDVTMAVRPLSPVFSERMQRFVSGLPGWMGEAILPSTGVRAGEIAEMALQIAPEPFAAPAMDGSILLKWDFPGDRSVEFYVEDTDSWDTAVAAVIDAGVVEETAIDSKDALLALLQDLGARART